MLSDASYPEMNYIYSNQRGYELPEYNTKEHYATFLQTVNNGQFGQFT